MNRPISGMTLIALSAALWGTVTVGVKFLYSLGHTTPMTVGWLRLTVAAPVLYLLGMWMTGENPLTSLGKTAMVRWLLFLAALTMALYQVLLFAALTRTSVTAGVVLTICSAPIFAGLMAWPFLGERPTMRIGLAMVGAISGTVILSNLTAWGEFVSLDYAWGNLLALGAGFSYASYSLVARGLVGKVQPWHIISMTFCGGSLLLLPFVLFEGITIQMNILGWIIVLYLGLVPTALAYVLYIFGLQTTLASVATTIALVEPLIATILAFIILGERLTLYERSGALILFGSMALLYRQRKGITA